MKEKSTGVKGRKYDASFKQEVLSMVSNGRPVSEVARRLGIGENLICRRKSPGVTPGNQSLHRQQTGVAIACSLYINASTNWSRKEIFKKALAIFSRQT